MSEISCDLGIPYVASEWPHGLRCSNCSHVLREGERYSTLLDSFSEDVPVAQVVCLSCALS
jgi:hypothetical protein